MFILGPPHPRARAAVRRQLAPAVALQLVPLPPTWPTWALLVLSVPPSWPFWLKLRLVKMDLAKFSGILIVHSLSISHFRDSCYPLKLCQYPYPLPRTFFDFLPTSNASNLTSSFAHFISYSRPSLFIHSTMRLF